jgi:hypothetical protein
MSGNIKSLLKKQTKNTVKIWISTGNENMFSRFSQLLLSFWKGGGALEKLRHSK